ncbi:MAG: imelysin family protein [Proteobacteria bacterium]|nr:imelysin family protein [Pseudomonadota bacterium]
MVTGIRSRLAGGPPSDPGPVRSSMWGLVAVVAAVACGSSTEKPQPVAFDRPAMLKHIGENMVLPIYRSVHTNAGELSSKVDDYCTALGTAGQQDALDAARDAWRATMAQWQLAEMMLFGPVAMDGKALRDRIYSWDLVSSCAVDQDVMRKHDDPTGYDITGRLSNVRGLDALEYLLFATSLDGECAVNNKPPGWDGLSDPERRQARCAFARDAASDLSTQTKSAVDAWASESGNYLADFAGAGQSASSFDSAQDAVNAVSDAMFYLDSQVKDMKLAEPAGIAMNRCAGVGTVCPDELESRYAGHSRENIVANLRAFGMLFTGNGPDSLDGLGFEDFLRAASADSLADNMGAAITAAVTAAEAIPGSMAGALNTDIDAVVATHTAVKRITDDLKTQFLTVLGLDIPDDAAADND